MSMFDNMKDKASDLVDGHGDKVGEGLDKAGEFADEKTGGKYSDQIDSGVDQAKDRLDGLDGQDDDIDNTDQ
jgi:ABC-type transporter Mla subunit MlaD